MTDNTLRQSPAYRVAYSMYVALGGDPISEFSSVEDIYIEINKLFGRDHDRINIEEVIMDIVENGDYTLDDEDITGYKPVNIKVEVPQKYSDEDVENIRSQAETDGYNRGEIAGSTAQKALLEEINIVENGVYEKEDGYKKVTVEVPIPEIPVFETEELSVELTTNGSYNYTPTTDGYSKVSVTVDVDTSGGGGKPKIYNSFIINANGAYADTLSNIDFSLYDWSGVYDLTEFFAGYKSRYSGAAWNASSFNNFIQNYNGKIVRGYQMFKYPAGSASYAALGEIPDFSKFSSDMVSLDGMFYDCQNLTKADNLAKWDTSNVINTKEMFYNCKNLPSVPFFDTSNVCNMEHMFYSCQKLTAIPQFDTSKVTTMQNMFHGCPNLTSLPELNCGNITSNYFDIFGSTSMQYLTDLGGFKDLGKVSSFGNPSYFLRYCPYLTKDSMMNVINKLYDRAAAGYATRKLIFSANALSQLSDEEKAIATNKGWTLATS